MCKINFNILRNLIVSRFEPDKVLSDSIFSFINYSDDDLKASLRKCCDLIRSEPLILITQDNNPDPDLLKTVAQTITLTAECLFKNNRHTIDHSFKQSWDLVKQHILHAINMLELMQQKYDYIGVYDQDEMHQLCLIPLENLGMHLNPYRLISSIFVCNKVYYDSSKHFDTNRLYDLLNDAQKWFFKFIGQRSEAEDMMVSLRAPQRLRI